MSIEYEYSHINNQEIIDYKETKKNKLISVLSLVIICSPMILALLSIFILVHINVMYKEIIKKNDDLVIKMESVERVIKETRDDAKSNTDEILHLEEKIENYNDDEMEYLLRDEDISKISEGIVDEICAELLKYKSLSPIESEYNKTDTNTNDSKQDTHEAYEGLIDAQNKILFDVLNSIADM